MLEMSDLIVRL
jgi:succinate dehydrogenase/fumarate reductase flavoprotein subunit